MGTRLRTGGNEQVYAVEASAFAGVAARNVQANGVAHIVQVIRSRVEDVSIPEKVCANPWV
jgi:predicted RNA methylase